MHPGFPMTISRYTRINFLFMNCFFNDILTSVSWR